MNQSAIPNLYERELAPHAPPREGRKSRDSKRFCVTACFAFGSQILNGFRLEIVEFFPEVLPHMELCRI
jgi:hypothetical protein